MTLTRRFPLAALALLLLTIPLFAACNDEDSTDPSPEVLGRQLTTRYVETLKTQDRARLEAFLSPAFQIARADGTHLDRDGYLQNFPKVNSFSIDEDLSARREGDLLTVYWTLSIDQLIDGKPVPTAPAPRLSVFQKVGGEWKLLAHANFIAPAR